MCHVTWVIWYEFYYMTHNIEFGRKNDVFQFQVIKPGFFRKCVGGWNFFCNIWTCHKISFLNICILHILWLICGWEEQKSKNELWLITLEFDIIWKIPIHCQKEHSIRLLSVKIFFQKLHSSARNPIQETFDFELSPRDFYVNLRGWNLILPAIGLIWRVLSDYNIKKMFRLLY